MQGIFFTGNLKLKFEIVEPEISKEKLPAPITVARIEFSAATQLFYLKNLLYSISRESKTPKSLKL